jgi:hypothetical protein
VKRFLSLVLISSLLFLPSTYAAPKKIAVKELKLVTAISSTEDVAGFVVSGKTIILFGTTVDRSFARAVDINGVELWRVPLDPDSPSIASAGAVDGAGNIWIAGSTSLLRASPAPSSSVTPINPDNVVNSPGVFNAELSAVALWKVPTGTTVPTLFSAQQSAPVLITGIAVDKNGVSLAGLTQTSQGSAGFVISANELGEFGKPLLIGAKSTTLDAVVRHTDSTLTAIGSSAETIGGKKLAGVIDGVIIRISTTNSILKVVRSSAIKAERNWSSATTTLLLGGSVTTGSKFESAVTKFSGAYVPTWTYRFLSTGPVFTLGSNYAFLNSTGTIAQLSNWKPKKSQPILLTFDSKGVITGAYSAPVDQKAVIGLVKSKELGVLCMSLNSELLSIYALP